MHSDFLYFGISVTAFILALVSILILIFFPQKFMSKVHQITQKIVDRQDVFSQEMKAKHDNLAIVLQDFKTSIALIDNDIKNNSKLSEENQRFMKERLVMIEKDIDEANHAVMAAMTMSRTK
jgi:N-dimethylarginine dimethylaminohydrolase